MESIEGKELLPPINPKACSATDEFAVFEYASDGLRLIETHRTAMAADKAAEILNNHSTRNGGNQKYDWAHTIMK